jgi:hypothetical protein
MVSVFGRALGEITGAVAPKRFAWSDRAAVGSLAAAHGLAVTTSPGELEIPAPSPAEYVDAGWEHPMALDARPVLERAGAIDAVRRQMIAALEAANEDPDAMLLRNPYVVHELRPLG